MELSKYDDSIKSNTISTTFQVRKVSKMGGIMMARSSNKLLVPGIEQALDQIKYEIAQEFGVQLGSDTVSRANGSVGGEITKRLVAQAQSQLKGQ